MNQITKNLCMAIAVGAATVVTASAEDYLMQAGNGHTVVVSDSFYFYDDGGPSGPISEGFAGSVTFVPAVADKAVRINTEEFAVSAGRMYVYSGAEANAEYILGKETGYFVSTGPKDLVSESEDGSITITFTGKGKNLKGWKIEVSLADKPRPQAEPMSGEYRVGASADARFRNLTELQTAFEAGVSGPVTILLENQTFAEEFLLQDIQGVSETNTITFTSLSGNATECVIAGSGAVPDYRGIFCVDATPFVTLSNITISAPQGNGSRTPYAALHLLNGSSNCTVENCVIKAPLTSENDNRTYDLLVNTGDKGACDNLTVTGNRIRGGYMGIYVGPDPEKDGQLATKGLRVVDNSIEDVNYRGVLLSDCEAFTLARNTVNPNGSGKKSAVYIDMVRPAGAFAVDANRVYSEQESDFTGIYLRAGRGSEDASHPALLTNNVVAIPNAANPYTYAMMIDASVKNLVVAHNSLNVNCKAKNIKTIFGMAFGGNASDNGEAPLVANNIVRTYMSGAPLRPWNTSHYANITFRGNVYYSDSELMDGDGNDFDAYRKAAGDESSIWYNTAFMSEGDLHLREAVRELFMPRLVHVLTDRDGKERSEYTTAGAYEYEMPAAEQPVIADGYPVVGELTEKTVEVKTQWSIGGKLYAKAIPTADEMPDADTLMQSTPVEIEADKEVVTTFTGLQPSTQYTAYFMAVSAMESESVIVSSPTFTTKDEIQPLQAFIFWQDEPFEQGETVELTAAPQGGVMPYTYRWTNKMNQEVGTEETISFTAIANDTYHLAVTSADGQSVICKVNVPVISEELLLATFDDLALAPESYWQYDTSVSDSGMYQDTFYSGSFAFGNSSMPAYNAWFGYGYSNETATDFTTLADQMRNAVGGGAMETASYGVAFLYGADSRIYLSVPEHGVEVPGMYVTNSAYTLCSIIEGDAYSPKFENGDYQEAIIEGLLDEETTGAVTVSLADYRLDTPYILTEWKWIDLSSLGKINALKITLEGNKYTTVPAYLCIDQIGARAPQVIGIDTVPAVSESAPRYYDLQGREIKHPTTELYIVVRGDKATKEYIR